MVMEKALWTYKTSSAITCSCTNCSTFSQWLIISMEDHKLLNTPVLPQMCTEVNLIQKICVPCYLLPFVLATLPWQSICCCNYLCSEVEVICYIASY